MRFRGLIPLHSWDTISRSAWGNFRKLRGASDLIVHEIQQAKLIRRWTKASCSFLWISSLRESLFIHLSNIFFFHVQEDSHLLVHIQHLTLVKYALPGPLGKVKSLLVPAYMTIAFTEITAPHLYSTLLLQEISSPLCCCIPVHALLLPSFSPCKYYCYSPQATIADSLHLHSGFFPALMPKTTSPSIPRHCLSMLLAIT